MHQLLQTRRYLTEFNAVRTPNILTNVLVLGSGIAGLRAALAAAEFGDVILVCKSSPDESNTRYAQGGIAVALPELSSLESHYQDTIRVGCGLCDARNVRFLVENGPVRVRELMDWGACFDLAQGRLAYTTEGGHSDARVLHAHGDATGQEIARTLLAKVQQCRTIRIFDRCFAIDLITADQRCVGAVTYHEKYGHQLIWARQTILATGGMGRLYRETTNPEVATGDGLGMAFRCGAQLQDLEMVQFHPTTLYIAGASRALISEAVRGEGGLLVDKSGRRFMSRYHPQAELAPRDVVSRSILRHMIETQATTVYLDVRHFAKGAFRERFPGIYRLCDDFGIDVEKDLIPVRPSAHYMIGGVSVDAQGRTTVPNLWACGEVAATGVHGANRLASNSLLEGLVWGAETGQQAGQIASSSPPAQPLPIQNIVPISQRQERSTSRCLRSTGRLPGASRHRPLSAEGQRILWS